ncbi:MAG: hypothetical protein ACLRNQ_05545 [Flavonifractor plautii]
MEEHHALSKRSRAAARRAAGGPAGLPGRRLSVYPRRAEHRRAWEERTRRKEETLARNRAIFRDYTAGLGVDELSARYLLAPKSIQRILTLGRRGLLEP